MNGLQRKRGKWRGERDGIPIVLAGGRREPDPDAVSALVAFDREAAMASAALALREHRDAPFSWDEVRTVYLFADKTGLVEWGLMATWDEEHTLGARFRDGELIELNGSVLAP